MPSRNFVFDAGGPPRLTLSWGMFWKNLTVTVDGLQVGTIAESAALKAGQEFRLPDGSTLSIRLDQGFGKADLLVLRDGKPLPGSAGDPVTQANTAATLLFVIAGLNALLGVIAVAIQSRVLDDLGLGWSSLCVAVVYGGLGFAVRRFRSRAALAIGMALFALDGLATLALSVGAGGRPPTGGIIFRIFLLTAMARAYPALAQVQALEAEQRKGGGGLPGGNDPQNPYQFTPKP